MKNTTYETQIRLKIVDMANTVTLGRLVRDDEVNTKILSELMSITVTHARQKLNALQKQGKLKQKILNICRVYCNQKRMPIFCAK